MRKQIIIQNLLLNYYKEGEGEIPLIFLHGWRSEARIWQPLTENVITLNPKRYTLYAIDLPGFGQSENQKNPFTLHNYAEIVKEFIKILHPKSSTLKPIIIGHSFGARIGIKLAAENPDLIQKLVIIDCGETHEQTIKIKIQKYSAKLVKPLFTPHFMQPLRKKIYKMLDAEDYLATPHLKETYKNIVSEPLKPLFEKIQTPTLIIWGEKDTTTPLTYGRKIHQAIHYSQLAIIKNAGHFPFIDQPEKCIKIICSFLA